jgi:hypothetical protein
MLGAADRGRVWGSRPIAGSNPALSVLPPQTRPRHTPPTGTWPPPAEASPYWSFGAVPNT